MAIASSIILVPAGIKLNGRQNIDKINITFVRTISKPD